MATKKEAFYNILTRFLREKNSQFSTINSTLITVNSGILGGLTFIPKGSRIVVLHKMSTNDIPKVSISIDIVINNSLETLIYKLHKLNFINEVHYTKLMVDSYAKAS
jgi:hypothetical protein